MIVVAVAQAAGGLHHALSLGHVGAGVLMYAMVFFGVWWAWMNFSWFASAYDNDDVVYRLLVLLQLTGALVFAAGIPRFEHADRTVGVLGYVLMRLALVTLWLRAAKADPPRQRSARRFALGVFLVQVAWVAFLFAPPELGMMSFWALAVCELLVPLWAERAAPTTWHEEHIAERYGLFTLITLGESILAASIAVRSATEAGASVKSLLPIIAGGLLIVFSFWWLYFEGHAHDALTSRGAAFVWGYGHYFVFAAAGRGRGARRLRGPRHASRRDFRGSSGRRGGGSSGGLSRVPLVPARPLGEVDGHSRGGAARGGGRATHAFHGPSRPRHRPPDGGAHRFQGRADVRSRVVPVADVTQAAGSGTRFQSSQGEAAGLCRFGGGVGSQGRFEGRARSFTLGAGQAGLAQALEKGRAKRARGGRFVAQSPLEGERRSSAAPLGESDPAEGIEGLRSLRFRHLGRTSREGFGFFEPRVVREEKPGEIVEGVGISRGENERRPVRSFRLGSPPPGRLGVPEVHEDPRGVRVRDAQSSIEVRGFLVPTFALEGNSAAQSIGDREGGRGDAQQRATRGFPAPVDRAQGRPPRPPVTVLEAEEELPRIEPVDDQIVENVSALARLVEKTHHQDGCATGIDLPSQRGHAALAQVRLEAASPRGENEVHRQHAALDLGKLSVEIGLRHRVA